ncbi:MAG TPA: class F sortase [Stackebrandtia sp.]|uniref:class F sortase n=1 Tax=Stackebrandtia sp. TaxID=2023065 RepID=UPI002D39F49E|nr:class F sortase [Stackebrandtia sp.]HZE38211.1 class F sortase [Stackebrandtia sp.]
MSPRSLAAASGQRVPRQVIVLVLLAVVAAAGCGLMLGGLTPWAVYAPRPDTVAHPASLPPVPTLAPGQHAPEALRRSAPTVVDIAAIGVHADVVPVGLHRDGTIAVPSLRRPELAGWFRSGPSPGESGVAALVGHVDSRASGAAVFYELGALAPGAAIEVSRADGSRARFLVDLVESYPKRRFPYGAVFGDTGYAALRLITCGGSFDAGHRSYRDNIVVYATMDYSTR